jgi:hypothetical protein
MNNTRLATAFQMQALEFRQRWLLLLIVLALPVVFFAANYYSTPSGDLTPVDVPVHGGTIEVYVDTRETWPMTIGIMGVAWGVSTIAFFAVVGNLWKDRRLLLCGYRAWQILFARLGLLISMSVPLAVAGMLPYTVVSSSLHPELVWLACFLAGIIAAGFGLLIGIVLPRPTEGLLMVLLVTGVGMSLGDEAARYFFLYPAWQMLTIGRLSPDPWPYSYIAQSVLVAGLFFALALAIWWWRTRLPRRVYRQTSQP